MLFKKTPWKQSIVAVVAGYMVFSASIGLAAPLELTLEDSVNLALNNNPSIKISEADRVAAQWKIDEAKGAKDLTASLSHTDTHVRTAPSTAVTWYNGVKTVTEVSGMSKNNFDNKLTLTLPLYTGGKVEGVIDQAKLGLTIAELSVQKSKQQIKLDATSAYLTVLQAQILLKLSQESVDRLTAHLQNVQAQYNVGTVAKVDVLRSQVESASAEQNLIKAQNALDLSVASLNNVLGLSLDTQVSLKDNLTYKAYSQPLEDCITYALAKRPEILQSNFAIEVAGLGKKVAKSGNLPTVGLQAYSDWNKDKFPGADNNNWAVALAANWNFFDAGVTKSKVQQAEATLIKSQEQMRQTKDLVQLDVRQSYLSLREAEKRIATSQVAVDKAEEDYKIAGVRYSSGVGTNLDVIDSQVALTQAKTNYVQALYDYNSSKAKLDKAMGI